MVGAQEGGHAALLGVFRPQMAFSEQASRMESLLWCPPDASRSALPSRRPLPRAGHLLRCASEQRLPTRVDWEMVSCAALQAPAWRHHRSSSLYPWPLA